MAAMVAGRKLSIQPVANGNGFNEES